jgi:hypothetical protein
MRTVHDLGYVGGRRDGLRGGIDLSRVKELAEVRAVRALSRRTYPTEQARTDALGLYARVWAMQVFEAMLNRAEGDTVREGMLWRHYGALLTQLG